MKCERIQKYHPLYIGADLSPKKEEVIRLHLDICGECQKEYELYVRPVVTVKKWLNESKIAWGEGEWRHTVQNTMAENQLCFIQFYIDKNNAIYRCKQFLKGIPDKSGVF